MLSGRIAKEVILQEGKNTHYVSNQLAVQINEKMTDYIPFMLFSENAKSFAKLLEKGDLISIVGKTRYGKYQSNNAEIERIYLQIDSFSILESKEYREYRKQRKTESEEKS
ncbi:single-stranded DNA-binding protein [Mycoplasma buteonis]|uniref:single-stranded DNA-binding protein n=1 Tax=Mycoplasma buteonis TaxID=171280 RepID=UPI0005609379|nr:single-stranded DNA-binding protein [Mycoplasma buteonis]